MTSFSQPRWGGRSGVRAPLRPPLRGCDASRRAGRRDRWPSPDRERMLGRTWRPRGSLQRPPRRGGRTSRDEAPAGPGPRPARPVELASDGFQPDIFVPVGRRSRGAVAPDGVPRRSLPWVRLGSGRRYFETEEGEPFLIIGQNDALTWPELEGLLDRRDLPSVDRHLAWLKAHGVTTLRLMLEYVGDGLYLERPCGSYDPVTVRAVDDLVALCEGHGLRLLLTPFDTFFTWVMWEDHPYNAERGGPCRRSDRPAGAPRRPGRGEGADRLRRGALGRLGRGLRLGPLERAGAPPRRPRGGRLGPAGRDALGDHLRPLGARPGDRAPALRQDAPPDGQPLRPRARGRAGRPGLPPPGPRLRHDAHLRAGRHRRAGQHAGRGRRHGALGPPRAVGDPRREAVHRQRDRPDPHLQGPRASPSPRPSTSPISATWPGPTSPAGAPAAGCAGPTACRTR